MYYHHPLNQKKQVLRIRSNKSIVIPQANTGNLITKRKVVTTKVQIKRTKDSRARFPFPFNAVDIKLNLATILLIPAICKEKIDKSTDTPSCPMLERGG